MNPGQEIVKWLRPAGCALALLIAALGMFLLLTAGDDPVAGYAPPKTSEYYAAHPEELKAELEQNVFPALPGVADCAVTGEGRLKITLTGADYAVTRSALLRYYDQGLFEFVYPSE